MDTGTHVPPGPFPAVVTLKIVKKDEFSTKCNQTDHHRMSGGRQEVSPGVGREAVERHSRGWLPFLVGTVGLGRAHEDPSFGTTALSRAAPHGPVGRACPLGLWEAASPCAVRGSEGCSELLSSLRGTWWPGILGRGSTVDVSCAGPPAICTSELMLF